MVEEEDTEEEANEISSTDPSYASPLEAQQVEMLENEEGLLILADPTWEGELNLPEITE